MLSFKNRDKKALVSSCLKKFVIALLVFVVPFTQILPYPVAYAVAFVEKADAPNSIATVYDLVAIVVDTKLDLDKAPYVGLAHQYQGLSQTSIGTRIMRYADDIVEKNPLTDVKIVFYDSSKDSVYDIASALENLYLNGDGTRENRLAGVVFVGDIPLPVVNKKGNRYASIFPYTDFTEKAYNYDIASKSFIRNEAVTFPRPEIWHGVIKAPENSAGGKQRLAEYFDKNHLYQQGVAEFADFDKKLFFGDLVHEEEKISPDIYKYYLKYLEGLEDLAYMRYNKYWAQEINGAQMGDIPATEGSAGSEMMESIQSGEAMAQTPDIYTKYIIDNSLTPYIKLLKQYVSQINDWADYTGRYKTTDISSVPVLITMKDEFAKAYLKTVNDALENEINKIVDKIQQPIPILANSRISGDIGGHPFEVTLTGDMLPPNMWKLDGIDIVRDDNKVSSLYYKYFYTNEVSGKTYLNGTDVSILNSPKQCIPYLGSTKSDYFDANLNFNPKAKIDGEYSVMTRALRSDNVSTAKGFRTAGVNTRLLSPRDIYERTAYANPVDGYGAAYGATITNGQFAFGKYSDKQFVSGAIVEDNPNYGVSAFEPNPMITNYENVLKTKGLQKGDIIVMLGYTYRDKDPVTGALKMVKMNQYLNPRLTFDVAIENIYQRAKASAKLFDNNSRVESFDVYFFRGNASQKLPASFTVIKDSELVSKDGSDGALFTLYSLRSDEEMVEEDDPAGDGNGYGDQGYDNSAGCSFINTMFFSDRCFYPVASMPVLDPAGAVAISKFIDPDENSSLKFKENFTQTPDTDGNYADHTWLLQYPADKKFEEIDDVYLDYCYNGLLAYDTNNSDHDSNSFRYPVDPETNQGFPDTVAYSEAIGIPAGPIAEIAALIMEELGMGAKPIKIDQDVYGRFLFNIGYFIERGDNDDDSWDVSTVVENESNGETSTSTLHLSGTDMKTPPSMGQVWNPIKNLNANSIVLNDNPAQYLTIKAFADRYGIFDGIDNDGDGLIDLADLADESLPDCGFDTPLPADQDPPKCGIDSNNLNEIARKLFSKTRTYTIPAAVSPIPGKIINLNVVATPYANNPEADSMIFHNEPTPYTIYQQVKSMAALSLPIDNPRYVAFQTKTIGDQTVGRTERIDYPNLFDIPNYAQLESNLRSIANKIASMPKAAESNLGSNDPVVISNLLYQQLMNVVNGNTLMDVPPTGTTVTKASQKKVADSLKWFHSNIDEKHRYILKYYLNPNEPAFIKDSPKGFEAAYLVLDGSTGSSFDMAFNKDLAEETSELFNPLDTSFGGASGDGAGDGEGDGAGDGEGDDGGDDGGSGNYFVMLPQFIKELMDFVKAFGSIPSFGSCCGAASDMKQELAEELAGPLGVPTPTELERASAKPLESLRVELDKDTINADGSDLITVNVTGLDEDGVPVGKTSNSEIVTINISQSSGSPVVTLSSLENMTLTNGKATFKLVTGGNEGLANISATSDSGKTSNSASVKAISTNVKLVSFVYFIPEGTDELQKLLAAEAAIDAITGNEDNGDNTGDSSSGDGTGIGDNSDTGDNLGTGDGDGIGDNSDTSNDSGDNTGDSSDTSDSSDNAGDSSDTSDSRDNAGDGSDTSDSSDNAGDSSGTNAGENTIDGEDLNDTLDSLSEEEEENKDKEVTVLVSELVEKTTLESTPVEDGTTTETSDWTEYYSVTEYYSQFLDEIENEIEDEIEDESGDENAPIWEEEYSMDEYYDKYLPTTEGPADFEDPSTDFEDVTWIKDSRLVAEVLRDVPMVRSPVVKAAIKDFNPFIDVEINPNSPYMIENGDKMVADGKTLMKVSAQILDANGKSDISTSHKVKFSISESDVPNMVTFVNGPMVNSENGVATVYLKAGTKTGDREGHFKIRAVVTDGDFPVVEKDLYLIAGDPYSVEITSDSGILVSNNQSKTKVYFTIKDKFGNVCTNAFSQIGVFAKKDKAYLDEKADANTNILGIQVATMDGTGNIDLYAKGSTGQVKVIALLFDSELEKAFLDAGDDWKAIPFHNYIGSSKTITIIDSVGLKLTLATNPVSLNGSTGLTSELLDNNGKTVESYKGPIKFTNLNDKIVNLVNQMPQKMDGGILDDSVMPIETSTLAGEAEILVEVPGFVSDSVKVKVLPGTAKKIELSSDVTDYIYAKGNNVTLKATLLDKYGNVVDTDNSTPIKFDITNLTEDFVQFMGAKTAIALKGVATTIIKGGNGSGKANLCAKKQAAGMLDDCEKDPDAVETTVKPGILSIKVVDHVTQIDAKEFSPRALYMSILGGAFGDPIVNNNLAQTFLYDTKARAQAITSLTSTPDEKKRILNVDAYGKISLMAEDIETKAVFATKSFNYQKIVVSDNVAKKELASIFLVPKNGLPLDIVTGDDLPSAEGIYVKQLLTDDPDLMITKKTDGIYVESEGETKAKIDLSGRISINDDIYGLRLVDEENDGFRTNNFSLVITVSEMPAALVTYKQNSGDVKTVPYYNNGNSFFPGVYVQLKSPSKKYDLISSFSGSSTAESKGVYLIDTEIPIDATQAPGFPQTSIEKAATSAGIGFDGQNKHMLFFTAGNSVGESNMPYASEVGITYGDPTVRLKVTGIVGMVSQFSGYAKTIGKPLFYGDEAILNMLEFDYNGDDYDDLLLVYEDGYIRLLENENSNKRFNDRGFILNIPGGAFSATKIDVNNDGYDDLLVGTKESCKKGEECTSLFTNIKGHLERQTLNLAVDGKIYEMKVGDANADGCDDIFTSDSAGNIRIFYNTNDGESCTGLSTNYGFSRNFGFAIDHNKNTVKSLYIYYPAVEQLYQNQVVLKSKQAAATDISSNEGMKTKIDLEKQVQKNRNKFLKLTLPSTQPPGPEKNDDDPNFTVAKNTDPNFSSAKYAQDAAAFQYMAQTNPEAHEKIVPQQTYPKEFNFINILDNPIFSSSTKFALDVNGQWANVGDEIQYDLTLKNTSGNALTNVMISDGTPAAIEIIKDSLKCMDANCPDTLTAESWVDTGVQLRSHVIKGISVPANSSRKIQYKFKLNSVPKVSFNVGKDLGKYPNHVADPYLDIMVRPAFKANKNIIMTHFYSTGINATNQVIYQRMDVGPTTDKSKLFNDLFQKNGFPLDKLLDNAANPTPSPDPKPWWYLGSQKKWEMKWWKEHKPEIDPALQESMFSQLSNLTADSNFNGIPNSWDGVTDNVPGQGMNTPQAPTTIPGEEPADADGGAGVGNGSGSSFDPSSIPNPLGELNDLANNVAAGVENALNMLRCAGAGCLPIPFNYAFLVPNLAIPGTPVVAWGIPPMIFVMAFWPSVAPSMGRFYISPTLDGGLAMSLCIGPGPGHASPCWAFAIPLGALGVCPDFMGMISDAIAAAKNAINSATGGAVAIASDGSDPGAADAAEGSETISGSSAYSEPDNPVQAGAAANIRIPGFPAVITDWLDRQIAEVYNKLLDLTDIYFVYPDFGSLGPQFELAGKNFEKANPENGSKDGLAWNSVHDFLRVVNSLPLITIEGKEVIIKVPTIPSNQIEKYKNQTREWLQYEKEQWESLKCNGDPQYVTVENSICEKFKLDFGDFIKGVESMLDTLDKISNLPYEILKWKNWEIKYATEIICYLDAIMTMIGGYIKKQIKIIEAWMEMVEEIIRIFKSWKMILDLIIEFQVSCDECKNDRFSMLGLLMQLFVVIPSPPIIPLPKWPDLVFDISQIQLGMNILWPDIVFKPEPIYLPNLPLITIPIIPDLTLELPGWVFDLKIPQLPELPDLPPLPIPKLPDLPRPPKIPALPDVVVSLLASLKPIFKILCLLKKGFIPVMESQLETEVETLTQPNLDVVLMLIASLAIQLPAISYDYVKEIRITTQIDVSIKADPIYNVVKAAADVWNNFLKKTIAKINQATQFPVQEMIDESLDAMMDAAAAAVAAAIAAAFDLGPGEEPKALEDMTEEELDQLKQAMGEEEFNKLMESMEAADATDNQTNSEDTDTVVGPNGERVPRVPTGTIPVKEKDPGQTLPIPEAEEIRTTSRNELLSYAPALAIKENVENFNKTIEDFVKTIEIDDTPSVYYLTATQTYLDKSDPILNRNLAQIKADIAKQDLPNNPEMNRLVQLRDSMIAYTENLESSNAELFSNINDTEKFGKILVQNDQSLKRIAALSKPTWFNDNQNTYIASNSEKDSNGNSYVKMPFFADNVTDQLTGVAKDTNNRLIAANMNSQLEASKTSNSSGPMPAPKGLFVIIDDKNENILNYTAELGGKTNMIFADVDHDNDEDLIYSLGGDVYLKENYKHTINQPHGDVLSLYSNNNSIDSYVNSGGNAIQSVEAPSDNNESADIAWMASGDPDTVAYEVVLRNSIYDDISDATYRYIVLADKADTPASIDILDKLDMEPPKEDDLDPKVFEMASPNATSISVKVVNGNYYANVFALDKDLNKSLESGFAITAPQDCADKEAPFPAIDPAYKIPIMKEFELDASNSFDANGRIVEYYVEPLPYINGEKKVTNLPLTIWSDVNVMFDSSGDGVPWNDKTNPKFKIGPFMNEGDIGTHEFILHVVDQSKNSSTQHFTLEVFVPNITLDDTLSREPVATGNTDPAVDKMPFSLMRKRFIYRVYNDELKLVSRLKKVATPSISPQQKYYTDDSGAYRIADLRTKDIITVENKDGVVIAEINPTTGDIGALKPGYSTRANEAVPPQTPTSVDIVDKTGNVLGSVYVIADANVDVTLHQNYGFETVDFASLYGVHTDDLNGNDDFVMKKFPANDPRYPGGAGLVYLKENKYLAFVDTSGNILLVDSRVTLTQKQNNHEIDPLIFELRFNNKPVVEIYISSLKRGESGIIVGPKDVPYTTPRAPSDLDLYGPAYKKGESISGNSIASNLDQFIGPIPGITDQNDNRGEADIADMLDDLYKRGLIDDLLSNSGFKLELDDAITRAEFVNVLLNMLCIIPRQPEAYTSYQANEGFSDMKYADGKLPWFFPYVKEAAMSDRQLIDGYTGKSDLDPVSGLPPFRPNNNITRAEATKIIIDALVMQGIIDGTKFVKDDSRPWYEPYVRASIDLTNYIKPDIAIKNTFILTAEEAQFPNKKLTFRDLLTMALRVIDLYDCWSIDADGDGMSDFYEKKHGIDDPNDDPDKDSLTNLEEFDFGSSPVDADTDKGGAKDNDEREWGTNPLDPIDDPFDNDGDGLTNMAEKLVYNTDPNNPDTDGGCAKDGVEVEKNTNPLDSNDDGVNCDAGDGAGDAAKEGDIGLYIVPAECDTCPCISTFDHKADIVPTDTFFSVISNFEESYFFSKSNEVNVTSVKTE